MAAVRRVPGVGARGVARERSVGGGRSMKTKRRG